MSNYIVGDKLAGKYEIKAILGAGGMGTVYRARQIDLGRDVAIKVPMAAALEIPGFMARFSREAKTVAKLVHDNIVQVYEYSEAGTEIYIVMEYVEGQDLKSLISKPPAGMTVRDLAIILRASCEGLGHAHEYGIVHRDIKPHNIMVEQRARGKWRVKIMDFGIAHLESNAQVTMQNENLTATGQAIGTPSYMSPEQIRGSGISSKSDIYSFGCVIYYCFTKVTPFSGTGFTVAAAHLSDAPPSIRQKAPALPEQVEEIINRCLEKDPALRPEEASDLGQEIYDALEPIFDVEMSEIWPEVPNDGLVDPLRPTNPFEPSRSHASDATEAGGNGDNRTITSDGTGAPKKGVTPPRVSRDNRPIPTIRVEQTRTTNKTQNKTSLTDATIPYAKLDVQDGPPPMEKPKSKAPLIGALIGGVVVVGIAGMVIFGPGKKDHTTTVPPISTPITTPSATTANPTPAPHETPAVATARPTEAVPTKPPTPSPIPTPTIDPVEARLTRINDDFARATDLLERFSAWSMASYDSMYAKDQKLRTAASRLAKEIAKNPTLVEVTEGTFTMGSDDSYAAADEKPASGVKTSAYEIGKYEVTALEFSAFLNDIQPAKALEIYDESKMTSIRIEDGTKRFIPVKERELYPIGGVSLAGAKTYTEWLSGATGKVYRLPTEAEWERAAKAGIKRKFPWGDSDPTSRTSNFNSSGPLTVNALPDGKNPWDLYNMAGNVAEWCTDIYDEKTYSQFATQNVNPKGPDSSSSARKRFVVRGGSYNSGTTEGVRAGIRDRYPEDTREPDIGFRLVREVR